MVGPYARRPLGLNRTFREAQLDSSVASDWDSILYNAGVGKSVGRLVFHIRSSAWGYKIRRKQNADRSKGLRGMARGAGRSNLLHALLAVGLGGTRPYTSGSVCVNRGLSWLTLAPPGMRNPLQDLRAIASPLKYRPLRAVYLLVSIDRSNRNSFTIWGLRTAQPAACEHQRAL